MWTAIAGDDGPATRQNDRNGPSDFVAAEPTGLEDLSITYDDDDVCHDQFGDVVYYAIVRGQSMSCDELIANALIVHK